MESAGRLEHNTTQSNSQSCQRKSTQRNYHKRNRKENYKELIECTTACTCRKAIPKELDFAVTPSRIPKEDIICQLKAALIPLVVTPETHQAEKKTHQDIHKEVNAFL